MNTFTAIAIGLPFLVYLVIALRDAFDIKSVDDFFLASRSLDGKGFILNAVGTNYSFLTLVFVLTFWGFSFGGAGWWPVVTFVIGFFLFAIQRFSLTGQKKFLEQGNTIHEFLGSRFRSYELRIITAITTAFAYLGYFVASIYIAGTFFSPVIGVGKWYIIAFLVCVTVLYTVLGGFKSVVKTDIVQILLILLGIGVFFYAFGVSDITFGKILSESLNGEEFLYPQKGYPYIIALFLVNGLWHFFAMDMWQRSISTGQAHTVIKGTIASGIMWGIIAIPAILLGIFVSLAHTGATLKTPMAVIQAFTDLLDSNGALALFYTSLIGALISSQDSNLAALSQTLYMDVWYPVKDKYQTVKEKLSLKQARWTVALSGVVGTIILYILVTLLAFNLVSFLFTFFSAQLVLLPLVVIGAYRTNIQMPSKYAIASALAGFLAAFGVGLYSVTYPAIQFWVPILSLGAAILPLLIYSLQLALQSANS